MQCPFPCRGRASPICSAASSTRSSFASPPRPTSPSSASRSPASKTPLVPRRSLSNGTQVPALLSTQPRRAVCPRAASVRDRGKGRHPQQPLRLPHAPPRHLRHPRHLGHRSALHCSVLYCNVFHFGVLPSNRRRPAAGPRATGIGPLRSGGRARGRSSSCRRCGGWRWPPRWPT